MIRRFLYAVLLLLPLSLSAQVRTERLLEKGWKFTREDAAEFSNPDFDDSAWQNVTVPHDWAIYGPFSIHNDRQNIAITQDGQKEAMEHAGAKLNKVAGIFYNLMEAHTSDEMQAIAEQVAPMLTEYSMYSSLNAPL